MTDSMADSMADIKTEDNMDDPEEKPVVSEEEEEEEEDREANDNKDKLWMRTYNFSEGQLAELKECFAMFDSTGNGMISAQHVGTALRAMGQNPTEADIQEMLQDVNLDDEGNLSMDEYIRLIGNRGLKSEEEMGEELEEALRTFDLNGEGCVDADQLKSALLSLGEPIGDDDISEMMKVAEVAGDGKINYYEFMKKLTAK